MVEAKGIVPWEPSVHWVNENQVYERDTDTNHISLPKRSQLFS